MLHPDGRALTYAELASAAAKLTTPDDKLPLRKPAEFRIIGQPTRVADGKDIVTGRAMYGIDARPPGALVAMIERCPYFDGSIERFDATAARRVPGVRDIVVIPGPGVDNPINRGALATGVAVVADDTWSARKGRDALKIAWRPGPYVNGSTDDLAKRARETARQPGASKARVDGDFEQARASAARVVEAEYTQPFLAHATLEPMNAFLDLKADREQAWRDFAGWRVNYDSVLQQLAKLVMAPPAPWITDRGPQPKYVPPLTLPSIERARARRRNRQNQRPPSNR